MLIILQKSGVSVCVCVCVGGGGEFPLRGPC